MQPAQKSKKSNGSKKKAGEQLSKEEATRRLKQSINDKRATRQGTAQFALRNLPQRATISREVLQVVGALIDPDNYPPFRLPDGGRKTFVNSLRNPIALADNGNDVSELTPGSGLGVIFRDPRCASITAKGSRGVSQYDAILPNGGTTLLATLPINTNIPIQILKYVPGTDKRHGDFMLPWVFNDGRPRMWVQSPVGKEAKFVFSGLAASTAYTLNVSWLCAKQVTIDAITVTTSPGGIGTFDCAALGLARKGYVALTMGTILGPGVSLRITDQSPTGFCHEAAPDFWDEIGSLDAIRVNSMSLMVSDRTNELTTQGDVQSYQCSGGITWDELYGLQSAAGNVDPYSAITGQTKLCYKGPYKKGKYLPAKSSADLSETKMIQLGDSSNPWDLPPIVVSQQLNFVTVGYNSHVIAGTLIGEWTYVWHVEGESESQWRDSRSPSMHPNVLTEAKHLLSAQEYDFENVSHLAKIWNIIKGVGKAVLPVAQSMIPMLPPQFQVPAYLGSQVAGNLFNQ